MVFLLLIHTLFVIILYHFQSSASCYFLLLTGVITVNILILNKIQKSNFPIFTVILLLIACYLHCYSLLFLGLFFHLKTVKIVSRSSDKISRFVPFSLFSIPYNGLEYASQAPTKKSAIGGL